MKQVIRNNNLFKKSLKCFDWLQPEIQGTDIDFLYERKGKILCLEGKSISNGKFLINFGQYKAIREITQNGYAFFIGYDNSDYVYVINLHKLNLTTTGQSNYEWSVKNWTILVNIKDCLKLKRSVFKQYIQIFINEFKRCKLKYKPIVYENDKNE